MLALFRYDIINLLNSFPDKKPVRLLDTDGWVNKFLLSTYSVVSRSQMLRRQGWAKQSQLLQCSHVLRQLCTSVILRLSWRAYYYFHILFEQTEGHQGNLSKSFVKVTQLITCQFRNWISIFILKFWDLSFPLQLLLIILAEIKIRKSILQTDIIV